MNTPEVTYFGAFIAGLLSFLSPCVLPLIPSYITYVSGISFADLQAEHPSHLVRLKALFHSLAFVAGFTIVFVALGASATYIGSFFQEYSILIRKIGGIVVIIFGVHLTGLLPIRLLLGEKRITIHHKPSGYLGSLLVGIAFAAGWTPCIGPILATILMIAAKEEKIAQGVVLLLMYSLGLGIPFVCSSLALSHFIKAFNMFRKYIRLFEISTGILLVCVGILIYFNWLSRIAGYITSFWE